MARFRMVLGFERPFPLDLNKLQRSMNNWDECCHVYPEVSTLDRDMAPAYTSKIQISSEALPYFPLDFGPREIFEKC